MSRAEFLTLAPGSDRLPVELFQILKDYAVKVLHSICNMPGDGSRHLQMRHISETIKWVPGSAGSVWPKIKQTLRPPGFMQSDKQTKLRSRAFW